MTTALFIAPVVGVLIGAVAGFIEGRSRRTGLALSIFIVGVLASACIMYYLHNHPEIISKIENL